MSDEFFQRFGEVDLGPKEHPQYGKVLYERTGGGLAQRYTLDGSGWALDAKQERAFRLGEGGRVFLPSGQEIARPAPHTPAKANDTPQRLYAAPPQKGGYQFGIRAVPPAPSKSSLAQRLFGRR
jgi:hypothetical protein